MKRPGFYVRQGARPPSRMRSRASLRTGASETVRGGGPGARPLPIFVDGDVRKDGGVL